MRVTGQWLRAGQAHTYNIDVEGALRLLKLHIARLFNRPVHVQHTMKKMRQPFKHQCAWESRWCARGARLRIDAKKYNGIDAHLLRGYARWRNHVVHAPREGYSSGLRNAYAAYARTVRMVGEIGRRGCWIGGHGAAKAAGAGHCMGARGEACTTTKYIVLVSSRWSRSRFMTGTIRSNQ